VVVDEDIGRAVELILELLPEKFFLIFFLAG
jgi:hypothetical protein